MKNYLLILLVSTFTSCATWNRTLEKIDDVTVRYDRLEELVNNFDSKTEEIKAVAQDALKFAKDADKDADGKVSLMELITAVVTTLGLGGGALLVRNGKSNERKAKVEARLENVERALPAVSPD